MKAYRPQCGQHRLSLPSRRGRGHAGRRRARVTISPS